MSSKDIQKRIPDGLNEQLPQWHFEKIIEFTQFKKEVGEPSPHLAMVGYMAKDEEIQERVWRLGCYAIFYCLPMAQVMWSNWPFDIAYSHPERVVDWMRDNWKGIITRTERRCVRGFNQMARCVTGFLHWQETEYWEIRQAQQLEKYQENNEYYQHVWESVSKIPFFGRYINIRFVEGLNRFCNIPAKLYDIRSVGGWSPKKALVYFYPQYAEKLLTDNAEGNELTGYLANDLLEQMRRYIPTLDHYVLAAMLCEYREAFEDHHQYPGWTIDQEPLLYDKVEKYWGQDLDRKLFLETRKSLFPEQALGELSGWHGTRWDLTKVLRDHGYNWSDILYDYRNTSNFSRPVRREV